MIAPQRPFGLPHTAPRRLFALTVAAVLSALLLTAGAARADSPSTLTVVGTSDVQDSGLVPDLIKPMFQKAYPKFTLNYVSLGTGAAINQAEAGVASALLVHAASLENQFVAQGYSAERFGRAIFWGDYVLLGPAGDPAHVMTNGAHDIATALADIAAAGAAGNADFVSRANTSGTAVQEHAIWALDSGAPGPTLCPVSSANGGGAAPSATTSCGSTPSYPSWYHATGLTQAPNIEAANACNFPNAVAHGTNDCYVFTDRGTFECLMSAACAGGSAAPTNLRIVTRDNSATARGGNTLLVNSFHAYAINPAKFASNPSVQINSTAAKDFLNFLTSPSFQTQLRSYLGATKDPPFIADAAPTVTASKPPAKVQAGKKITVKGTIANVVPGTPPLASQTVTVSEVGAGIAVSIPIASAKTSSTGAYSIRFAAPSTGLYQVTTGQIFQIENSKLSPVFGDILAPGASPTSKITVQSALQGVSVRGLPGQVLVTGSVLPGANHANASVVLLGRRGTRGAFRRLATSRLGSGDHAFAIGASLASGRLFVRVRFQDPGQVLAVTSRTSSVLVPSSSAAAVRVRGVSIRRGRITVSARVAPRPLAGGTTVELLGLDAGALKGKTTAAGAARFKVVARATVRAGRATVTLHGRLARGQHWILQLRYSTGGSAGVAYSRLVSVRVT